MDLQKEREAFEAVISIHHCIYNADLNYYFSGSKFVSDKAEIEVNAGWKAWQAAKAIPEGFVLVSQKELLELVIAINAVDLATHTEGKPNEVREMWQQVALKLGALCSAGAKP
ncbi:hypothetical protein HX112_09035 [Acinetobacter towneri]|uniref:hypothetical protein n=1 Tax=Acinetobacter towneri TaxID=202956 RepID=UPI002577D2C9|nr:hypothetical protein [Acinetobacter towneri]MDM1736688.1 hypothetical protein [Acinetobacter towneri]